MKAYSLTAAVNLCAVLLLAPLASWADDSIETLANTCASCHGANGVAAGPLWPNLAGQKRGYLAKQITAYRDGTLQDASMQAFVKDLSDEQIDQLAGHFSALPMPGNADADKINMAGMNVRANCLSCHGVHGVSVNDSWPNLAGQKSAYILKQLRAYRDGTRVAPLMNVIANELTDQQMKDVAEYYSQLAY